MNTPSRGLPEGLPRFHVEMELPAVPLTSVGSCGHMHGPSRTSPSGQLSESRLTAANDRQLATACWHLFPLDNYISSLISAGKYALPVAIFLGDGQHISQPYTPSTARSATLNLNQ